MKVTNAFENNVFLQHARNTDKIGRVAVCRKALVFGMGTSEIYLGPINVIIDGFMKHMINKQNFKRIKKTFNVTAQCPST